MKSYEEIYEFVKCELSEKRFNHSIGVMERCIEFAKLNGEDIEKAKIIGIAHDIKKEVPKESIVKLAIESGIELDEFEKENPAIIHAKFGAKFCKENFLFTEDMCSAVEAHTVAKADMKNLDKILYLSDFCEKGRKFKQAQMAYELGKKNLNEGYFYVLVEKIKNLLTENKKIHKNSIEAYNSYLEQFK